MKILIVDDSKIMRMHVQRAFRQAGFSNHDFIEASNGLEAWEIIEKNCPDLLLTDLNMPVMSGFELIDKISDSEMTLPVGVISSQSTDAIRQKVTEAGALFLLAKPFTPEAIQKALEKVVK